MTIKLIGKTAKACNNITQYADKGEFILLEVSQFKNKNAILVKSPISSWFGWFIQNEVLIETNNQFQVR